MSNPSAETDVLILCGGAGKRLGSLTENCPKPMIPVEGKPFLEILIDQVKKAGLKRIILCTGYLDQVIRDHFASRSDVELEYSHEREALGTGGGLKLAEPLVRSAHVLVLNGDSFCDVNLNELLSFHTAQGALATLTVSEPDAERKDTGNIEVNTENQVLSFAEKKGNDKACVNAGIYAMKKEIFQRIPESRSVSLEKEVFPQLKADELYAYRCGKKLYDIGTPERLEVFRQMYKKDNVISS